MLLALILGWVTAIAMFIVYANDKSTGTYQVGEIVGKDTVRNSSYDTYYFFHIYRKDEGTNQFQTVKIPVTRELYDAFKKGDKLAVRL